MSRTPESILFVGRKKCGKTTLCRKFIEQSKFKKILVIDTYEHPDYADFQTIPSSMLKSWKQGRKRIILDQRKKNYEDLQPVNDYVCNTLIILEDASKYIVGDIPTVLRGILFDHRNKGNELLIMYHGFRFVPPKLLSNVSYITLFKIGEHIKSSQDKVPNYAELEKGHLQIQASNNQYIYKSYSVN
jgi:hypothetical protein